MKTLLNLLAGTIILIDSTYCTARVERRLAITPLIGAEQFYIRVKKSRQPIEHFENETLKVKTDICAAIIRNSPSHANQDLYAVSLREEGILDELKRSHPLVFEDILRNQSCGTSHTDFANPYLLRDISVNGIPLQEPVFCCTARNRKSTSVLLYFISPEYNVNESTQEDSEKLLGRFVFAPCERNKEMTLIALAEEPAHKLVHGPDSVEHLFQEEIDDEETEQSRRTICNMTTFQKVRLCTSILSADDHVQLIVDTDYAEPKCVLREIHFEHFEELHYVDDYEQWWESADPFKEWMLVCKAGRIGNNNGSLTYFVSRGFAANKFFISKEVPNNGSVTLLQSISINVGVVPAVYL